MYLRPFSVRSDKWERNRISMVVSAGLNLTVVLTVGSPCVLQRDALGQSQDNGRGHIRALLVRSFSSVTAHDRCDRTLVVQRRK